MNSREPAQKNQTELQTDRKENSPEEPTSRGPSLVVMYVALGIALAAAIGLAMLIVWPFYRRVAH